MYQFYKYREDPMQILKTDTTGNELYPAIEVTSRLSCSFAIEMQGGLGIFFIGYFLLLYFVISRLSLSQDIVCNLKELTTL